MKKNDWIFEVSSGYNGYRCKNCSTWIYEFDEKICNCNKIMKKKKYKVEIPEGYRVTREIWPTKNNDKVVIKFESIKKDLPKTWAEFYNMEENKLKGQIEVTGPMHYEFTALWKLILLRDHYNDGWKPDWTNNSSKYIIYIDSLIISIAHVTRDNHVLVFKTIELRTEFLSNFAQLINEAKPLL